MSLSPESEKYQHYWPVSRVYQQKIENKTPPLPSPQILDVVRRVQAVVVRDLKVVTEEIRLPILSAQLQIDLLTADHEKFRNHGKLRSSSFNGDQGLQDVAYDCFEVAQIARS